MLIALGLCWSCPEKDIDFEQGGFDMLDLGPDSSWEDCGKYMPPYNFNKIKLCCYQILVLFCLI